MAFIRKIQDYLEQRTVYKRTFNELSALSNRELNDIGINRSEIYNIAHQEMLRKKR